MKKERLSKNGSCVFRGLPADLPAALQSPQFPFPGLSSSCLTRCLFLSRSEFMMRVLLPGCLLSWLRPFTSPASKVRRPPGAPDCCYLRWRRCRYKWSMVCLVKPTRCETPYRCDISCILSLSCVFFWSETPSGHYVGKKRARDT